MEKGLTEPKPNKNISHNKANCGLVHAFDKILLKTIDDSALMALIVKSYRDAFFHTNGQAAKLKSVAQTKYGIYESFVAICRLYPHDLVNTKKVAWIIKTELDANMAYLPWDQLKKNKGKIMIHIRIFYGDDRSNLVQDTFFANA